MNDSLARNAVKVARLVELLLTGLCGRRHLSSVAAFCQSHELGKVLSQTHRHGVDIVSFIINAHTAERRISGLSIAM